MGKNDMPDMPVRPPPVTPESDEVKVAGQRKLEQIKQKRGRLSTILNRGQTGFTAAMGSRTGGVDQ